ncbi:MAG: hypothetical protein JXR97_14300 [Planctomycetes bacterium]|nr:hypothetical protein [Planctomycetota bacterium]
MGLLDKLKGIKNALTGGGASVRIEVGEALLGQPVPVTVYADVSDQELKINKVYLIIRAEEEIRANDVEVRVNRNIAEDDGNGMDATQRIDVSHEVETYRNEVAISGADTLAPNQNCEWYGEFTIPVHERPTYAGVNCKHSWSIFAGLDAFGNDPDSGWVEFVVKA